MDDANEGLAAGECPGHLFGRPRIVIGERATFEATCLRCGTVTMDQPGIHAVEAAQRAKRRRRDPGQA